MRRSNSKKNQRPDSMEKVVIEAVENPISSPIQLHDKTSKFEKEAIGNFVLQLYHEQIIPFDGLISKERTRREFRYYCNKNDDVKKQIGNANIGTLLKHSKFLINTPRDSKMFNISVRSIIMFRDEKKRKDLAGSFLLNLYHQEKLSRNSGIISKSMLIGEFEHYLKKSQKKREKIFNNLVIGNLLRESNFLINTPRGSSNYCISMRRLFEYRNEKLKQLDETRINNDSQKSNALSGSEEANETPLETEIEISPDAEKFPVIYEGGCQQIVIPDFTLTSLGCFICQTNFKTQLEFEDHVTTHGIESDFEFLTNQHKRKNNIFKIFYRLCDKSHFFNFTMETKEKDIIIEKLIIVQTSLMHYVKNNKVPYEIATDGLDSFFVDSHIFTIGVEQPLVLVYRKKFEKCVRYFEQHHFLRTDEFPQVHFPIRGYRLLKNTTLKNKHKLDDYFPRKAVKDAQKSNFSDESLSVISYEVRNYLSDGRVLNAHNTCEVLDVLLQIEDIEGMRGFASLRQSKVRIKRFGHEYSVKLKLPAKVLLENILTPLDEIIILPSKDFYGQISMDLDKLSVPNGEKKVYFALVERVYSSQVCFKYDKSIISDTELYDIILRPSRLTLKYQYRALSMLSSNSSMKNYLFPRASKSNSYPSSQSVTLFNEAIEKNPEQLQAVRNIAHGPSSFAPYIIFGPPGTGKTSTIVESVLQLWQRRPDTQILITAGSNAACDEVAIRLCRVLIELEPHKPNILRIFSKSNEKRLDSMDDILIEASNFYGAHFYPSVEAIREYRIIVCTLSIVGKLVTADIGADFFSHIFIDECAASTQPEVLVGWMGTSNNSTRLIISGDHKQLGPILKSRRASELGLSESLMERLLRQDCYAVDEYGDYDRSIQTRLRQNFRSHPEIVALYNDLYYNRELKAMASGDDTLWALNWHMLPNKTYPIVFHSVYGNSRTMGGSVSLCNDLEVATVLDYVKDLIYFGIKGQKIEETDIGIISPYKKQCILIQEELNRRRWHQIEVGAVETFQGKEKPIIIVSHVRSFTKSLGFLENPRRLNVVLSRAKALLILIGNPRTLSLNKDFKYVIDECRKNNCTVGGFRGYDDEKTVDKKEVNVIKKSPSKGSVNKAPSRKAKQQQKQKQSLKAIRPEMLRDTACKQQGKTYSLKPSPLPSIPTEKQYQEAMNTKSTKYETNLETFMKRMSLNKSTTSTVVTVRTNDVKRYENMWAGPSISKFSLTRTPVSSRSYRYNTEVKNVTVPNQTLNKTTTDNRNEGTRPSSSIYKVPERSSEHLVNTTDNSVWYNQSYNIPVETGRVESSVFDSHNTNRNTFSKYLDAKEKRSKPNRCVLS